jgi:hypothetical protein
VARACTILREFEDDQQMLSLNDIVNRTSLERTICFRLLHTLKQERFLRRVAGRRYACNICLLTQKRFRIAYASQTVDSFSNAVGQGLRWAASEHQVDLVEIEEAVRRARECASAGVRYAIEPHLDSICTEVESTPRFSGCFRGADTKLDYGHFITLARHQSRCTVCSPSLLMSMHGEALSEDSEPRLRQHNRLSGHAGWTARARVRRLARTGICGCTGRVAIVPIGVGRFQNNAGRMNHV